MHELSIAMGIVAIAEKEARKAGVERFSAVELEIGQLSGVEIEALEFAWPMAVAGSVLEGARKIIHRIPAKARCLECGTEFDLENLFDACPHCGSYFKEVYQGKEMRVKALEI
jgi:hydrogenase nickel incorporation protein HypA/HybF